MSALVLAALIGLDAGPASDFEPCLAGLERVYDDGLVERVRGWSSDAEPVCLVEQGGAIAARVEAREVREDRVAFAGVDATRLAFRVPFLRGPLGVGRAWRYDTTRFEVASVGARIETAAGAFTDTVIVVEHAPWGAIERVYARGVGLVRETGGQRARVLRGWKSPPGP